MVQIDTEAGTKPDRRAEIIYRRGKCLQEGGAYNEAARCFSEVERLPLAADQKKRAQRYLLECLSALGKETAREHVARTFAVPDAFPEKAEVVTLDLNGSRLAVELSALLEAGGYVTEVGGLPVVFVATGNGARVYQAVDGIEVVDGSVVFDGTPITVSEDAIELSDGTVLPRVISGQSFWFAWAGNHPTTAWWPQS